MREVHPATVLNLPPCFLSYVVKTLDIFRLMMGNIVRVFCNLRSYKAAGQCNLSKCNTESISHPLLRLALWITMNHVRETQVRSTSIANGSCVWVGTFIVKFCQIFVMVYGALVCLGITRKVFDRGAVYCACDMPISKGKMLA